MLRRTFGILVLGILAAGIVRAEVSMTQSAGVQHWFGVATENLPEAVAKQLKLKPGQGLIVVQVFPKSPAEEAGLQRDDFIVEVDGKPLMTQEDLVRAANALDKNGAIRPAKFGYLRGGDHFDVTIAGAPRTEQVIVANASGNFVAGQTQGKAGSGNSTIITSNGQQANIGGGIVIPLNGTESQQLRIGELAKGKDNIILTVATDAEGKQRRSISVGDKTYVVEKEKLGDLPADVRPLAEQLLKNGVQQTVRQGANGMNADERLRELEKSNAELKQKIEQLEKAQKGTK
jgi:membrane-associated protease RseP (regulator of RpoE activity)